MPDPADRPANEGPMVVDNHGHISQLEIQDVAEGIKRSPYEKILKYGMSHRDNLTLMDAIGVDVQVLHASRAYLHPYHRRVIREHPDRFIAICNVDPRKTVTDEGLEMVRMYVEDWGFRGRYYDPWPPETRVSLSMDPAEWGTPDPFYHFDDDKFRPHWELVQSLKVPVCLVSYPQNFETLWPTTSRLLEKFPDLTVVIIHGIDPPSCLNEDGTVSIPESAVRLVNDHERVYVDLLPGLDGLRGKPNRYGPDDQVIKAFFDTFGPSKLLWGTEFTHIEEPTVDQYRYQFDYVKERCSYMTADDLAMIRGENARRAYGL